MKYIGAKEAASNWKIAVRRVQFFCANEKIPGAKRVGNQWIIPADAKRPADGRYKEYKGKKLLPYRFPLLVYSDAFAAADELSEAEQALLRAQLLYLEGNFPESIALCRELCSHSDKNIAFGAELMLAYNSLVLALYSDYKASIAVIEEMTAQETAHQEDYRLAAEALQYYLTWNAVPLLCIDPAKLSVGAQLYFQYVMMLISTFTATKESANAVRVYESICLQAECRGLLPSAMTFHFMLISANMQVNDLRQSEPHMKAACEIGIAGKWNLLLAKHYFIAPTMMDKYLKEKGEVYRLQITSLAKILFAGVNILKLAECEQTIAENTSICGKHFNSGYRASSSASVRISQQTHCYGIELLRKHGGQTGQGPLQQVSSCR